MSNQIVISSGAKVRELEGVLTGTSGVVNSLGINVPSGIPQLDASGKILVSQLPNSVMEYKGTWNAATNTPTLVDGTGNQGDVYLCNVAGTVNFGSGPIAFFVGDQVIYSGTIWQRASGATGTVTSVAVTESGDSLNITGSPITTSGTINIGFNGDNTQYINGAGNLTTFPSLAGYVPYTGATTNVNLGTFDLSADAILGATGSFISNGSANTFDIEHSSGSGIALSIVKEGNNEGLYVEKTSGSGNAATIIGTLNATTLVKSGGTSSQFLKADGSIDSSTYLTTSAAASTYVPYTGATANVDLGTRFLTTSNNISASSFVGQLAVILGTSSYGGTVGLYPNETYTLTSGFLNINASSSTKLNLSFGQGSGVYKYAIFDVTGLTNDTNRTYALQDASGTIALLSGTQTFTGATTFSSDITVNGLRVGKGLASMFGNTALGVSSLNANTTGNANTAIGYFTLSQNTTGFSNVAIGYNSMVSSNGNANTAIGNQSMQLNTNGVNNTAIGHTALQSNTTGNNNIGIGYESGLNITTGNYNTIIGSYAGTATMSNNIILADGQGNIRYQWNGTNNVFGNPISGTSATFSGRIGTSLSSSGVNFNNSSLYVNNTANTKGAIFGYNDTADNFYFTALEYGVQYKPILFNTSAATFSSSVTAGSEFISYSGITMDAGGGLIRGGLTINYVTGEFKSFCGVAGNTYFQTFNTNGSERMRITSAGNVGIGTSTFPTSSNRLLFLNAPSGAAAQFLLGENGTSYAYLAAYGGSAELFTTAAIPLIFGTNNTERMRITSGGQVLINTSSDSYGDGSALVTQSNKGATIQTTAGGGYCALVLRRTASDGGLTEHYYQSTFVGGINISTTSTSYGTSSDYRLKEDLKEINGLEKVSAIKVYDFKWKTSGERNDGVLAHELADVLPYAVTGEKDGEQMQGVDYSKIVPVLVKAIQEQQAQIEELSNKIVALQSK